MLALGGQLRPPLGVIAIVTHALGIVFLLRVGTGTDLINSFALLGVGLLEHCAPGYFSHETYLLGIASELKAQRWLTKVL